MLECEEMKRTDYYRIKNPKTGKTLKTIYYWWHHIPMKYTIGDYLIEAWDGKEWYNIDN